MSAREILTAAGLKARVKDLGNKVRVCAPRETLEQARAVLKAARFTDVLGHVEGGDFSAREELVSYKPGSIRRMS